MLGLANRMFFTWEDLENTQDFFHNGMSTLVHPVNPEMVIDQEQVWNVIQLLLYPNPTIENFTLIA